MGHRYFPTCGLRSGNSAPHLSRSRFSSSLCSDPQLLSSFLLLKHVCECPLVGLLSWALQLDQSQVRIADSAPEGPGRCCKRGKGAWWGPRAPGGAPLQPACAYTCPLAPHGQVFAFFQAKPEIRIDVKSPHSKYKLSNEFKFLDTCKQI